MKLVYKDSLGLPNGFRVQQYETSEIAAMTSDPKKLESITNAVNLYFGQKDVLVAGRSDLVFLLDSKTSFKREVTTSTVDGKEQKEFKLTEAKYIAAFIAAATAGQVKEVKVDMTQNEEQREAVAYTFLQTLANQCGDFDDKGNEVPRNKDGELTGPAYSYRIDVTRPERATKPKTPPKYAIEGATNIINNGAKSIAKWKDNFAKGFTAKTGEKITPITVLPFDTVAPTGATPEAVEAVRQANINALAWGIVDVEEQKRAQRASDYA